MCAFDGFDQVIELSRRIHEQRMRVGDRDRVYLLRTMMIDEMIDDAIARLTANLKQKGLMK